jgi:hypothetical protein
MKLLPFIFNCIVYLIVFKIRSGSASSIGYDSFPGTEVSFLFVEPRRIEPFKILMLTSCCPAYCVDPNTMIP